MVYLNIGSNLGQAEENLRKALEAIETRFEVSLSVSAPYYSLPWGYDSGNFYTNIGVAFDISVDDPTLLLQQLLDIQFGICPKTHRNADGGYVDRIIDIDLIAIDNRVIESPTLILPHPRMHLRDFVLVPMAELAPEWRHPLYNLTCSQMLDKLKDAPNPELENRVTENGKPRSMDGIPLSPNEDKDSNSK